MELAKKISNKRLISGLSVLSRDDSFLFSQNSANKSVKRLPLRRESQVRSTTKLKKYSLEDKEQINEYTVVRLLGEGVFASVILCKHIKTHVLYALKKMNKKHL